MLQLENLRQEVAVLSSKYNVEKVDLFGSYATGKATDESDVDLLVKFSKQPPSIFAVMGLKEELQRKLLVSVDVVTLPLSRPDKFSIERTLNVYEKR